MSRNRTRPVGYPGCPAQVHGTAYTAHRRGCVCPDAVVALRRQRKRTRVRAAREGELLIDPTGTIRRIQALRRLGYPLRRIAVEAGYTPNPGALTFVHGRGVKIHADRARRIAEVYDRLSMTPGPDIRARRHAERMGWPPPLAWDDEAIDDPKARPRTGPRVERYRHVDVIAVEEAVAGRKVRLTVHERREAVLRMRELGMSARQIGDRLGMTTEAARRLGSRAQRRMTEVAA